VWSHRPLHFVQYTITAGAVRQLAKGGRLKKRVVGIFPWATVSEDMVFSQSGDSFRNVTFAMVQLLF
jgi:hypothetical protein